MVVEVLNLVPNGASAQQILSFIKERFGQDILRPSLSPQLTRLKNEGVLKRTGRIWSLRNEEDPAEAGPDNQDMGAGWNQQGPPKPMPAGSTPVASTLVSRDDDELQLTSSQLSTSNTPTSEKEDEHDFV